MSILILDKFVFRICFTTRFMSREEREKRALQREVIKVKKYLRVNIIKVLGKKGRCQ